MLDRSLKWKINQSNNPNLPNHNPNPANHNQTNPINLTRPINQSKVCHGFSSSSALLIFFQKDCGSGSRGHTRWGPPGRCGRGRWIQIWKVFRGCVLHLVIPLDIFGQTETAIDWRLKIRENSGFKYKNYRSTSSLNCVSPLLCLVTRGPEGRWNLSRHVLLYETKPTGLSFLNKLPSTTRLTW